MNGSKFRKTALVNAFKKTKQNTPKFTIFLHIVGREKTPSIASEKKKINAEEASYGARRTSHDADHPLVGFFFVLFCLFLGNER